MKAAIFPVILCGGAGTRLWPMSRRLLPKQFLKLGSARSLLQDTGLRLADVSNLGESLVVCNEETRFLVAEQLEEVMPAAIQLLLEPVARNTAPAIAAAALAALEKDAEALLFVLPSDHLISELDTFLSAASRAISLAHQGWLVTFGIPARSPDTGFGYIERGDALSEAESFAVRRFVEKPGFETALRYCRDGSYAWNSGMFVFQARQFIQELGDHRPDILSAVRLSWKGRSHDGLFTRLEPAAFSSCPADSVDYAVMERTRRAAVISADFGWSDVGSWNALWDVRPKDAAGNVLEGDVSVHDVQNSYIRAESRLVAVSGLQDVIVVETSDAILITRRDQAQVVKDIVSRLETAGRTEHVSHRRVYRPWGYYESVDSGPCFQVKRLMVKAGQSISLQLHHQRAEHWVVVSGIARITRADEVFDLSPNQSTFIPVGTKHRLENPGAQPLLVVEVQSGSYLGEDDIVRFEDKYSRT
jgi:mannose-1-phosphate guanylyltransferase/mannose-6-phosphate isomerase